MRNALISVYHKDGIVEFAQALVELKFTIYASGGTFKHLTDNGVAALPVSALVGGEAILGHRVVTLSREIHAGLLAQSTEADTAELAALGIPRIDLVCVDLYPLEAEIAKPGCSRKSVIEMTDVGGPTMIRSGVKGRRIVICDPADRAKVIEWLQAGEPTNGFVENLCAKGEFTIAAYCMASANYLSGGKYDGFSGEHITTCRYGENASQAPAYLFSTGTGDSLGLDKFVVVEGVAPSYNNWCDIDRMLQTMSHVVAVCTQEKNACPAIAIGVKHGNPCGAAIARDGRAALEKMAAGDPLALFGGLVMVNFKVSDELRESLAAVMLDGMVAPAFSGGARAMLRRKGDRCRFIENPALAGSGCTFDSTPRFRQIRGGFLMQPNYRYVLDFGKEGLVKYGSASRQQERDMLLAWAIGSTSNSNTITLVKDGQLIGNGVGQQDRVGAAELAITRARRSGHDITGAVAYSDSFFPFPDGPAKLIEAGVTAIITTSGSVRDKETISLCAGHGIALYMIPDAVGRGFFGH